MKNKLPIVLLLIILTILTSLLYFNCNGYISMPIFNLSAPLISKYGGIYDNTTDLIIDVTGDIKGEQIYYTLDGTFPTVTNYTGYGLNYLSISSGYSFLSLFTTKLGYKNSDVIGALYSKYKWTKRIGGSDNDLPSAITVDFDNNILVTGKFWGFVDFDSSSNDDFKTSSGDYDIFVTKINKDKSYSWTGTYGGTGFDQGRGVSVNSSNDVYIVGDEWNNSDGYSDGFIKKYDSAGNFGWNKIIGSSQDDSATSIAFDSSDNFFVCGYFSGTVDFDTSIGTNLITSHGQRDIFISKYGNNDAYIWTHTFGADQDDYAYSICVDSSGDVYVVGSFNDKIQIGANLYSAVGGSDIFIVKLSNAGTVLWGKTLGSSEDDSGQSVIFYNNEIFVTGLFASNCNFNTDSNSEVHKSLGGKDVFVTSYDCDGNYKWTKTFGNQNDDSVKSIFASNNKVYVTGSFTDTINFASLGSDNSMSSNGKSDSYLLVFSSYKGVFGLGINIGGDRDDYGFGVCGDSIGNTFITGAFQGNVDFNTGESLDRYNSYGESDVFITSIR